MKQNQEQVYFNAKNFNDYLNSIIHHWSKTLATLGITLVPLFGVLDYYIMPSDLVSRFWIYRLISTALTGLIFIFIRSTHHSKYSFLYGYCITIIISLTIIQMTVELGGFNANYQQGLNLVIIAVNLLVPWKPIHSAINGAITVLLYFFINLITPQEYDAKLLVSNLFFMNATVIIAVSINYVRHSLIKKEYHLRRELKSARDALWGEMEIAKKIQTALLPEQSNLPGFSVYATMLPADEVGGDYYDVIETPNGELWLAIGDVSGHGVESGLIMMMTHTSIYSLVNQEKDLKPSGVLNKLNYVIKENIKRLDVSRYMTLTVLKLSQNSFIHSGKHQDILVYRAKNDQVQAIESQGTWIGITDDLKNYTKDYTETLQSGDVMLLYTDGITEASNSENEMFSYDRLVHSFKKNAKLPIEKIVDNMLNEVKEFQHTQEDDITLLVVRKL